MKMIYKQFMEYMHGNQLFQRKEIILVKIFYPEDMQLGNDLCIQLAAVQTLLFPFIHVVEKRFIHVFPANITDADVELRIILPDIILHRRVVFAEPGVDQVVDRQ